MTDNRNNTSNYIKAMASIRGNGFRILNAKTGLFIVALVISCFLSSNLVRAEPEPGPFYSDSFSNDPESLHLLQRLRQLAQLDREIKEQGREIVEEEMAIESVLEGKAADMGIAHYSQRELPEDDGNEPLPIPLAQRSSKRGSYMALCHFKICNMGRKRQLPLTQIRTNMKIPSLKSWVSFGPRTSGTLLRLPIS